MERDRRTGPYGAFLASVNLLSLSLSLGGAFVFLFWSTNSKGSRTGYIITGISVRAVGIFVGLVGYSVRAIGYTRDGYVFRDVAWDGSDSLTKDVFVHGYQTMSHAIIRGGRGGRGGLKKWSRRGEHIGRTLAPCSLALLVPMIFSLWFS